MPKLDWIVETSSTTGTGAYQLSGEPPPGTSYLTFRQRYADGAEVRPYYVVNPTRTKWEKNRPGVLTYGTPDALSRGVIASTNTDAPVPWQPEDLPLSIYVVPDIDADEFAVTMGLGPARPDALRFGIWADEDALDTGVHQLKHYDGANETAVGSANTVANQTILFGLPPGFIKSNMARNSGTPTTKLDVTFTCMDSTDAVGMRRTTTLTKRTGGTWAAGDDANGMGNALTIANNTWYHVFAILVDGVVDCYIDTSITAANKPAGTTHFRRLGSMKTNGSAQIIDFFQDGDHFAWVAAVVDINANAPGTSAVLRTLSVPTGLIVEAMFIASGSNVNVSIGTALSVSDPAATAFTTNMVSAIATAAGNAAYSAGSFRVRTNTSGQVRTQFTGLGDADVTLLMVTQGWIDRRGRDD